MNSTPHRLHFALLRLRFVLPLLVWTVMVTRVQAVAIDLYMGDSIDANIKVLKTAGQQTTIAPDWFPGGPVPLRFNKSGNLYIGDSAGFTPGSGTIYKRTTESALSASGRAGAYVIVKGYNGETGTGLVEVYRLPIGVQSRLMSYRRWYPEILPWLIGPFILVARRSGVVPHRLAMKPFLRGRRCIIGTCNVLELVYSLSSADVA